MLFNASWFGFLASAFVSKDYLSHWQSIFSVGDTDPAAGGKLITPEISRYVENIRKASDVTGLTIAVVRRNGETELGAWGDKTEDGVKMTTDSLFHMASCSKAFLAASIGILMEDYATGKNSTPLPAGLKEFNWDTKVKDILPNDWELMDEWANEKANIRDQLGHVTGLPRHDYSYGPGDSAQDVVRRLRYLRPAYELREKWSYNNQMYVTGAHIVSTYTGSYITFAKERIFGPLNMSSTTFSLAEAKQEGKMTQAWTSTGRRIPQWLTDDIMDSIAGAGGIISSASDMAKWVGTMLNSGRSAYTNDTIIPKSVFDNVTTARVLAGEAPNSDYSILGYGMGWMRSSYLGHEIATHGGAVPGFSTVVSFLPSDGLGVVVLANGDEKAKSLTEITTRVIRSALGISETAEDSSPREEHVTINAAINGTEFIDLQRYSGTYSNPGYGTFTLCDSSSDSFYCTGVLSDFAAVDSQRSGSNQNELVGAWPRIWSTHMRLVHMEGERFNLTMTALFPRGYGVDTTPFETHETGTSEAVAEFVVENSKVIGFGLFGTVGEQTERERKGIAVEEKAEVWFVKGS